jgi:hypothetical protein
MIYRDSISIEMYNLCKHVLFCFAVFLKSGESKTPNKNTPAAAHLFGLSTLPWCRLMASV